MNSPVIKPTVGRVVWFYPATNSVEGGFARNSGDAPLAAIVARVWSDSMVNLTVFDADGAPHPRTSVQLLQDIQGDRPAGAYCTWMPYQKSQAAKTEVADKGIVLEPKYRDPTQREQLEYALVSGAAAHLAQAPGSTAKTAPAASAERATAGPARARRTRRSPAQRPAAAAAHRCGLYAT